MTYQKEKEMNESIKVANTEGLEEQAAAQLRSVTGYHFSPDTLKRVIEAGEVPAGALVAYRGDIEIFHTSGGAFEARKPSGEVIKSLPAGAIKPEDALIEYAKREAKRAVFK